MSEFTNNNQTKTQMNTCPKCGSAAVPEEPHKYPSTRIHFACDGYGYTDGGEFDLVYRSELCLEREDKNTLQRKAEELQVALDFANEAIDQRERSRKETEAKLDDLQASTIHSCGDSCSRPMCVLRRERDELREELERERMRLAACGVVADANTPESAKKWRNMRDEYRSASCDGVARAVDREMRLRRALQKNGNDPCVPPMIADEALTAIEDVRENAEAECVQIVDGIVRPVPWDNWRNCANQLLKSLKYIHSVCEDKTIELPADDYAKATIDECIMEAERAMQKFKKMKGDVK